MARTRKHQRLPKFTDLFVPVVQALIDLGGSGNIEEINERVYEITNLSEDVLNIPHGKDGRTEIEYQLAWTRTYLKKYGLLENSARELS
ncbi:winged helix-turn-helix domain-containing protein [Spirosoma sp. KCTC 42546]|uniref:winged helix-turn-helix domain-containing protein n=1 Tax=Spirosoma sp. KCTC 42546 TaxID=2520506 RepID=UPI001FEFAF63|nr:winged helix-turn-helix domain-containing protein [Spirosoma sp. KCTC 42546]